MVKREVRGCRCCKTREARQNLSALLDEVGRGRQAAIETCRSLDMRFWLEGAEAELARLV